MVPALNIFLLAINAYSTRQHPLQREMPALAKVK